MTISHPGETEASLLVNYIADLSHADDCHGWPRLLSVMLMCVSIALTMTSSYAGGGVTLGTSVLLWWLGVRVMRRLDHTPPVQYSIECDGLGLLWFGSLGSTRGDLIERHLPVQVAPSYHDVRLIADSDLQIAFCVSSRTTADRFACIPPGDIPLAIHLKTVLSITSACVATRFGPLHALRVEFVDEHGLRRRGTIAAGTRAERDALALTLQAPYLRVVRA